MLKLDKEVKKEFLWLGFIGLVDFSLIQFIVGWGNWGLDIAIRDSYVVLSVRQVFFLVFLNICFVVYLIRVLLDKFKNQTVNIILLIITGTLIYITSLTVKFYGSLDQGWLLYPPFSSTSSILKQKYSITAAINVYVQLYEIVQLITLSVTGIMIGRGLKRA